MGETRKGEGMERCTLVFADCEPAAREQLFQSASGGGRQVVVRYFRLSKGINLKRTSERMEKAH